MQLNSVLGNSNDDDDDHDDKPTSILSCIM